MLLISDSVVSNTLGPHGLQHARLPCPSSSPGACPNSCPLSRWCHPIISFSVAPFSSCPHSFLASGSFPMSQLFALDSESIGASTSASVLSMNIQDWFPLGLTGLISCCPRDSPESSPIPQFKSINSVLSFLYSPILTSIHDYWKNIALTRWTFVDKVMSLLFNMLSRLVITFLLRSQSVQFSRSVMSDSLRPHESQHARPPCPLPTFVHRVSDAIQPSHPLLSHSPPAFNLSQHQGLRKDFSFIRKWVSSSHEVAKVLEFQLQQQSFQWTPRTDLF